MCLSGAGVRRGNFGILCILIRLMLLIQKMKEEFDLAKDALPKTVMSNTVHLGWYYFIFFSFSYAQ